MGVGDMVGGWEIVPVTAGMDHSFKHFINNGGIIKKITNFKS